MDGNDCVWLLGGQCDVTETNIIWKTCNAGSIWTPLSVPTIVSIPGLNHSWPSQFSGHAIAIVGGWKLVVVDSMSSKVYVALDKLAKMMKLASSSPPFRAR